MDDFFENAHSFLAKTFRLLEERKISIPLDWEIDHVCYRVETLEQYQNLKNKIQNFSELLIESPINGRNISTFKLHSPISFQGRVIKLIELPAPKEKTFYKEGFEHFEVVPDIALLDLEKKYPMVQFNKDAYSKKINRDISFEIEDYTIKFHEESLEKVIIRELEELK